MNLSASPRFIIASAIARRHALRAWTVIAPWLAAAALVFGYLFICSWMENNELQAKFHASEEHALALGNAYVALRVHVGELEARSPGGVLYLIDGADIYEVQRKLERISMSLARDHFQLQQATTNGRKP